LAELLPEAMAQRARGGVELPLPENKTSAFVKKPAT